MIEEKVCPEHSGIVSDIKSLRTCTASQKKELGAIRTKVDGMMSRLNIILGGIIVSILMLLLDIIVKIN